jgi:hypothetical protein
MHPKEKKMCIADYVGDISLYTLDDVPKKLKTISLPEKYKQCYKHFFQYSPEGAYIVAGSERNLFIIDPDKDDNTYPNIEAKSNQKFRSIAFHPHNSVLAISLSASEFLADPQFASEFLDDPRFKAIVRFWDLKTQQFMDTPLKFMNATGFDLAFSSDGLYLFFVLQDTNTFQYKCLRGLVPFAVKACLYHLFVLNQIKQQAGWSSDIVHCCMNILLET